MIKTIKVKKQLRLDELIKYVWDNDVQNERFRSKESDILVLVEHGRVLTEWTIDKCETFTVEVQEAITEDTVFEELVTVGIHGTISQHENTSLSMLHDKGLKEQGRQVFALINGKLELIYESGVSG